MGAFRIIGIGNQFRGDDAVGVLAARRLRELVGERADVVEAELAGIEVLEMMDGAEAVIIIDAARSGQPAGTIHRIDASTEPIAPNLFPHSTHALNAVDVLELGRALGKLPPRIIVYGIEGGNMAAGSTLSPVVAQALETMVERIVQEIKVLSHA